jgi:hypothetical protein
MGRSGFLLNPLIENNYDLIRLYGTTTGRQVVNFSIEVDPRHAGYYQTHADVSVESVSRVVGSQLPDSDLHRVLYPGFKSIPSEVRSDSLIAIDQYGTADTLVVHPTGEVVLNVPPGARQLAARFGLMPIAYDVGDTDGVLFSVEHESEKKTTVLFSRYLDPRREPLDRGIHEMNVSLPAPGRGTVRLRTTIPDHTSNTWDWSYWSDVALH